MPERFYRRRIVAPRRIAAVILFERFAVGIGDGEMLERHRFCKAMREYEDVTLMKCATFDTHTAFRAIRTSRGGRLAATEESERAGERL